MPTPRVDTWLTFLALLLFVALLALVANAYGQAAIGPIETDNSVIELAAIDQIDEYKGAFLLVRWADGREVHVRIGAVNIVRIYPAGHEGGHPTLATIEMIAAGAMQRIEVPKSVAEELRISGTRERLMTYKPDSGWEKSVDSPSE